MSTFKVKIGFFGNRDPQELEISYPHLKNEDLRQHAMKRVMADLIIDELKDIQFARSIELFGKIEEEEEDNAVL